MSRHRRPVILPCAEPGCKEHAYYEEEDRELRQRPWHCVRHSRPEQVLGVENLLRECILEVYEKPYGKFWRTVGTEESGSGFEYGPGFKAFACDFPVGTKLIVAARIEVGIP